MYGTLYLSKLHVRVRFNEVLGGDFVSSTLFEVQIHDTCAMTSLSNKQAKLVTWDHTDICM